MIFLRSLLTTFVVNNLRGAPDRLVPKTEPTYSVLVPDLHCSRFLRTCSNVHSRSRISVSFILMTSFFCAGEHDCIKCNFIIHELTQHVVKVAIHHQPLFMVSKSQTVIEHQRKWSSFLEHQNKFVTLTKGRTRRTKRKVVRRVVGQNPTSHRRFCRTRKEMFAWQKGMC